MKEFVKKVSQKISKLSDEQVEQLLEAINEENETLDSILESLSSGLVIVDVDWHILQTNKAAERLLPFNARPNDVHSDTDFVWDYIEDNEIKEFLKECCEKQKTNVSEEFSVSGNDSKNRFISIAVLPLVHKSKNAENQALQTEVLGSIITINDITEKRTQEVLLHRMETLSSLTNLAASVAHEIKNPLGAISIHIQLLQKAVKKSREGDGLLPDEKFMEKYLDVVNEEIDNLNKIVIDFLFAVKPVQAQLKLINPDQLLEKFTAFFKPEFDDKKIDVKLRLSEKNCRLLLDEKLFREVILNMTQNALSAINSRFENTSDSGDSAASDEKGQLIIESAVKNERYYLTIADNGCGMDEKTAARIFEPYYTTKANGTGLGMTMVYKIIKEFQGDVDVKSVEGHGTVFTIMLPVPQTSTMLLPGE